MYDKRDVFCDNRSEGGGAIVTNHCMDRGLANRGLHIQSRLISMADIGYFIIALSTMGLSCGNHGTTKPMDPKFSLG